VPGQPALLIDSVGRTEGAVVTFIYFTPFAIAFVSRSPSSD
jgi:hypothetical protein